MQIHYNSKTDLLYLRFDDKPQAVVNRRVSDDVVLDVGRNDRLVGIEIMEASKHVRMDQLLPVTYEDEVGGSLAVAVRECPASYGAMSRNRRKR